MARNEAGGTPFVQSASGTAIAIATQTGTTGAIYYLTDVQASTVASAGTFSILGGSSVLWQGQLGTVPYIHSWSTPLNGGKGNSMVFTVNGTTTTYANMSGYIVFTQ